MPGPGSYIYSCSDFDKKSNANRSTNASFLSKASRFSSKLEEDVVKEKYIEELKSRYFENIK
jgi:hypothetical protein